MATPKTLEGIAPAYLVSKPTEKEIYHPLYGVQIYWVDKSWNKGSLVLQSVSRTYKVMDTMIVQAGEILIPESLAGSLDGDEMYLKLSKLGDLKHKHLQLLKRDLPFYVELGILEPLDGSGLLAHEYGIL